MLEHRRYRAEVWLVRASTLLGQEVLRCPQRQAETPKHLLVRLCPCVHCSDQPLSLRLRKTLTTRRHHELLHAKEWRRPIDAISPNQQKYPIVHRNKKFQELRLHLRDEVCAVLVVNQSSRAALRAEFLRASALVKRSYAATMSATMR